MLTSAKNVRKTRKNRRFHLVNGNGRKIWTVHPKSMFRYSNESFLNVENYEIKRNRSKCELLCIFGHWNRQILNKFSKSTDPQIICGKIENFQNCYFLMKIWVKIHILSNNHAIWSIFVDFMIFFIFRHFLINNAKNR